MPELVELELLRASLDLEMVLNIWSINSTSISQKLGDLALLSLIAADPET